MWKFCPSTDYDGLGRSQPLLRTLNDHVGRQVWCWDEHAGTVEERAAVEKARAKFTESRLSQKHAADELLRCCGFERWVHFLPVPGEWVWIISAREFNLFS